MKQYSMIEGARVFNLTYPKIKQVLRINYSQDPHDPIIFGSKLSIIHDSNLIYTYARFDPIVFYHDPTFFIMIQFFLAGIPQSIAWGTGVRNII